MRSFARLAHEKRATERALIGGLEVGETNVLWKDAPKENNRIKVRA